MLTSALHDNTENLVAWIEGLAPDSGYPNQKALLEHITAIRNLLPPVEE